MINFEHLSKIAEALEVTDIRELIDFDLLYYSITKNMIGRVIY